MRTPLALTRHGDAGGSGADGGWSAPALGSCRSLLRAVAALRGGTELEAVRAVGEFTHHHPAARGVKPQVQPSLSTGAASDHRNAAEAQNLQRLIDILPPTVSRWALIGSTAAPPKIEDDGEMITAAADAVDVVAAPRGADRRGVTSVGQSPDLQTASRASAATASCWPIVGGGR